MRDALLREGVARQMGQRDEVGADRVLRQIDEAGFERPVLFDAGDAGEAPVDIVIGAERRADARE